MTLQEQLAAAREAFKLAPIPYYTRKILTLENAIARGT
jgi:hypothetical protein